MCFIWGLIAFGLAFVINSAMLNAEIVTEAQFLRFSAPFVEEILKGIILVLMVRRPRFQYFVDGAIYGFACGIGFAVAENYFYVLNNPGAELDIAVARVISTNLMHATASSLIGIAFGYARNHAGVRHTLTVLTGIVIAMLLHIGFNNLVTRDLFNNPLILLAYAAAVGIGGAAFIYYTIKRGLAGAKEWIKNNLGEADRVTHAEVAAVNQLGNLDTVLEPVVELFGPQKTQQVERFLVLQAQLGIYRQQLGELPDEKLRVQQDNLIETTRLQMDEIRQALGPYIMVTVRTLFPEDIPSTYLTLDTRITQSKLIRNPKTPSLFTTLDSKLISKDAAPND